MLTVIAAYGSGRTIVLVDVGQIQRSSLLQLLWGFNIASEGFTSKPTVKLVLSPAAIESDKLSGNHGYSLMGSGVTWNKLTSYALSSSVGASRETVRSDSKDRNAGCKPPCNPSEQSMRGI